MTSAVSGNVYLDGIAPVGPSWDPYTGSSLMQNADCDARRGPSDPAGHDSAGSPERLRAADLDRSPGRVQWCGDSPTRSGGWAQAPSKDGA
jgi:hypothetical protein